MCQHYDAYYMSQALMHEATRTQPAENEQRTDRGLGLPGLLAYVVGLELVAFSLAIVADWLA